MLFESVSMLSTEHINDQNKSSESGLFLAARASTKELPITIAMPITAVAAKTGCRLIVPSGIIEKMVHPASPMADTIAPVAAMIPPLIMNGGVSMLFTGNCRLARRQDSNVREASAIFSHDRSQ
ncbi:MAG: hypothetical protein WBZ29_01015 [Methanocella sp.]